MHRKCLVRIAKHAGEPPNEPVNRCSLYRRDASAAGNVKIGGLLKSSAFSQEMSIDPGKGTMTQPTKLTVLAITVFGLVSQLPISAQKMNYPVTQKSIVLDTYFGVSVADPYRWLEDDVRESDQVRRWVDAQNKVTFSYLEELPFRSDIEKRLTTLWNYERFGAPFKVADKYYFSKNNGLQNQSVLYRMDSLDAEPELVLDPNAWSKDGTVALGGLSFSDDGRYMAYGIQDGGSDWRTWRIKDLKSDKLLDDELKWLKFGGISWLKDGSGFFYSRFPAPDSGEKFQSTNLNNRIYFHQIGTPQKDDVLIHKDDEHPEFGFIPSVTEDGDYLVITVWKGTDNRYQVYYKSLKDANAKIVRLIDNFEQEYSFIENYGSTFLFKTNLDAPNGKVIAIDVDNADRANWKTVVPEAKEALSDVGLVNHTLICEYLKDAKTQIKMYDRNGKFVREVEFPGIGSAGGFGGKKTHKETFYSFSSFATPPSTFRYDMESGESTLIRQAKVAFNPEDYVVKQVFYKSKDGTKVPMFIAHKKGIQLNGNNPTLLYGYGGFNISLTPGFSVSRLQWMEMGGVFAMPNLRGGGEYGERWHKAGTKTSKQNVFDDFIAAAEYLIENKYTSKDNLGIQGGSNGGLLVGACMTQRPDLYGACLPAVGVMDMLRFQEFTAGRYWVDDYGSSKGSKAEFEALLKYSPYHNLAEGTKYPPTLVTTADTDDRVVPGHSFKFAARLQECHEGDNPVLIRIETRAGHGAGKPTSKQIEEVADQWSFLVKHLGMQPKIPSSKDKK